MFRLRALSTDVNPRGDAFGAWVDEGEVARDRSVAPYGGALNDRWRGAHSTSCGAPAASSSGTPANAS